MRSRVRWPGARRKFCAGGPSIRFTPTSSLIVRRRDGEADTRVSLRVFVGAATLSPSVCLLDETVTRAERIELSRGVWAAHLHCCAVGDFGPCQRSCDCLCGAGTQLGTF